MVCLAFLKSKEFEELGYKGVIGGKYLCKTPVRAGFYVPVIPLRESFDKTLGIVSCLKPSSDDVAVIVDVPDGQPVSAAGVIVGNTVNAPHAVNMYLVSEIRKANLRDYVVCAEKNWVTVAKKYISNWSEKEETASAWQYEDVIDRRLPETQQLDSVILQGICKMLAARMDALRIDEGKRCAG